MNNHFDAIIIGGGPSGATTAILLARAGWSVAIIEKKSFPRVKVCGEFISATNTHLLQQLNLFDFYSKLAGPPIKRVGWFAANKKLTAVMPIVNNQENHWGRALGREYLDTTLLNTAKNVGAIVLQPYKAVDLKQDTSQVTCSVTSEAETHVLTAPIAIVAQGSWEKPVLPHHKSIQRDSDLLAFKTHFKNTNLDSDLMPMISFSGGYGGLVHTDSDRVTLSCCIRRDTLQQIRAAHSGLTAGDAVLNYIFSENQAVADVLGCAKHIDNWLAVGPLHPGIRKCYQNRVFFVGNIAGEAHPIIAEGISMGMQSGWLLAHTLIQNGRKDNWETAGNQYTHKWRKQFSKRIYAAAFFMNLVTRPIGMKTLLPIVEYFPKVLTFCASLSGKAELLP